MTKRIVTIRFDRDLNEYRVPGPNGTEKQAYYSSELDDALGYAEHVWSGTDVEFRIKVVKTTDAF